MVMYGNRLIINQITNVFSISSATIENILHDGIALKMTFPNLPVDLVTEKSDIVWGASVWVPKPRWVHNFESETFYSVETPLLICSKECHVWFICREDDGFSNFECKSHCVYWQSSKFPHHQWGLLCQFAETDAQLFETGFVSSEQWYRTEVLCFNNCFMWHWLWTGSSASLSYWFDYY